MLTENLNKDERDGFDRKLNADPSAPPLHPYDGGPNRNVMALMAAARMPQAKPFASPGSEWKPGDKR